MTYRSDNSETRQRRVLFSEGSSTSARQAVYALGRQHHVEIVDPAPLCQCRFSSLVRRWHCCSSFTRDPEKYLSFLVDKIRTRNINVLLPTHEQVTLLSRFRDELSDIVGVALPDFEVLCSVLGKAEFSRVLDEVGLPQPRCVTVKNKDALLAVTDLPCFVKMSHSTAGEGVRRAQSSSDLQNIADEIEKQGWFEIDEVIVQQLAKGFNCGVNGVFQHGRLVAAHCTQLRFKNTGGWFIAIEGVSHPQAIEHLRVLGEHLRWHGAICLEYFYDPETDQCQIIECNPRVGETLNATLSGVNLCEQLVRVSMNEDVDEMEPGHVGIRTHQSFVILMAKAWAGAGRRELLSEIFARWSNKASLYQESEDELTRPGEDWLSVIPSTYVTCQLLMMPSLARSIVKKTVDNYSAPGDSVDRIRNLDANAVPGLGTA